MINIQNKIKLFVAIHSWHRVPNNPYFMKTSPPLLPNSLSTFLKFSLTSPSRLFPPTYNLLLNDIMDLHILEFGTLVLEGPCCMFYATRRQGY